MVRVVDEYINKRTWRVNENANRIPSIGGLKTYIAEKTIAKHTLSLYDEEVRRALAVTEELWKGERGDPRPHLLLKLLLHTAIKKSECISIHLEHIDRSAPGGPFVYIRYDNPDKKIKERKLPLPDDILPVLDAYLECYQPGDLLFPCTARNLEYVLADVAARAGIKKRGKEGISFEMLRWTAAVRDYRAGMDETLLRQKLGISEVTWKETRKKLDALTAAGRET